jgi:hypothetical protein
MGCLVVWRWETVFTARQGQEEEQLMFEGKKKICRFYKDKYGSLHAGGGPLGHYRISKTKKGHGWKVWWSGGAVRSKGEMKVRTLREAKKLVAFDLGCRWPR